MKGIHYGKSYGSLDAATIITIEADESTPLLVDRMQWTEENAGGGSTSYNHQALPHGQDSASCSWSYASGGSYWTQTSSASTKSFKSHFSEINVLVFVFSILAGLGIAVYLLIIETRLPSIIFSLDLVHHDAWSRRLLPKNSELNSNNVNNVIFIQTGSKSCDNSYQCSKVLHEMQDNNGPEELPYNFLIAHAGLVFEVRGWSHESGMPNVPQSSTLVIGLLANYEIFPPEDLLRTAHFLIRESLKRHKLQPNYHIYGVP